MKAGETRAESGSIKFPGPYSLRDWMMLMIFFWPRYCGCEKRTGEEKKDGSSAGRLTRGWSVSASPVASAFPLEKAENLGPSSWCT